MASTITYTAKSGAIDPGRDYEHFVTSYAILNLLSNTEIEDFYVASNAEGYGVFDDIVIKLTYRNGNTDEHIIQLKHVFNNRTLTQESLKRVDGKFSIAKYFKSYRENIQNKRTKMVLYTNMKYEHNNFCLSLEGSTVESRQSEADFFLNTSKNNTCCKFQITQDLCTNEDLTRFLGNFSLYANQTNSVQLRELISQKFRQHFCCDEDACEKYLQFINDWSKQVGRKEMLNKTWIQQSITIRLLSPYIHPINKNVLYQEKFTNLKKAIGIFNITIFQEEANVNLKHLWSFSEFDFQDIRVLNKVRTKFFLKINPILNANDLSDLEKTQLLWLVGKCPLIVPENEAVLKAVQLFRQGKFILLRNKENDANIGHNSVFKTLYDLCGKPQIEPQTQPQIEPQIFQQIVQQTKCLLQGTEITLEYLLTRHPDLASKITPNSLFKMLNEESFVIGESKEELPKPHIRRRLSTFVIDVDFLNHIKKAEEKILVVLSCDNIQDKIQDVLKNLKAINVNDYLQNSAKLSGENIFVCDGRCSQENFNQICNRNKSVKQCHHFLITEDGNLEWAQSKGTPDNLEEFLLKDRCIEESELCSLDYGNNINIICANPGMGKSILAKNLKNNLSSKYWPILIYPTDISSYFCKKENITFVQFIEKKQSKKYVELEKAVMESYKSKNLLTYIWDGLDEVSDENLKNLLHIIDNLSKKNILQWITSRSHLKEKLERRFKTISRTILQFDEEQQESFIQQRLENVGHKDIQEIVKNIKQNIEIIRCNEVLGIPLQIYMLTELFCQDVSKYSKLLKNMFSLADLYHHFVNEKFNYYYKEKAKINNANDCLKQILNAYKDSYLKKYEKAALKTLKWSDTLGIPNVECDTFLEKIKNECDSFGLITEVSDSMTPTFVHNSYGEFFVASYFFKNYKKIPNLKDVLFKERYTNIRFLFDLLMANNSPTHIAVLYKNFKVLVEHESQLNLADQGGRNALLVACTWGQKYPLLKTTLSEDENNTYHIDEKPGESVEEEDPEYQKMIIYISEKCDHKEKDQLFKMDAISYADEALCLFPLIHFSQKFGLNVSNLSKFKDIGTLLYYGIKFDCVYILDLIKDIPFIKTKKRSLSLLHLCAEFNSIKCLEYLLQMEKYKTVINTADVFYVYPATIACKKGHHNILKMLINAGADLSWCVFHLLKAASKGGYYEVVNLLLKYDGFSMNNDRGSITASLQSACLNGYEDIVQLLIEYGAKVNVNTRHGTPLYIACQYGYKGIVKILLEADADVNKCNKFGFTPLHIACQRKYIDIVKLLISFEANVNAGDNNKITPLHVVSKNGSEEILTLLLTAGAEVNKANKKKITPLCNACQCGNEGIVKMLTEAGADVNLACSEGCTPIYLACEKGWINIVQLLLGCKVNINVANDKYVLPLHIAQQNGFQEIVGLLTSFAKENYCSENMY